MERTKMLDHWCPWNGHPTVCLTPHFPIKFLLCFIVCFFCLVVLLLLLLLFVSLSWTLEMIWARYHSLFSFTQMFLASVRCMAYVYINTYRIFVRTLTYHHLPVFRQPAIFKRARTVSNMLFRDSQPWMSCFLFKYISLSCQLTSLSLSQVYETVIW